MRLPRDPGRLAPIRDFLTWKQAVEGILARMDSRLAGTGHTGVIVAWQGSTSPIPRGMLQANGQVVNRADFPRLFAAIGTTYNTGGEAGTAFRLPNWTTPPATGAWVILT